MHRHNFKELLIWQLGMDIVDDVYRETKQFPKEEQFGLKLQLRKSAVSTPSNIAEGCGRGTSRQLVQFLNIAQGSAFELETQIYIAIRQQFGEGKKWEEVVTKVRELQRMLDGFADRFV
jgi:four helix bundle protein